MVTDEDRGTVGVDVGEQDGAAHDAGARVQLGALQRHAHQHVAVPGAADAEPPRAVEVAALPAAHPPTLTSTSPKSILLLTRYL